MPNIAPTPAGGSHGRAPGFARSRSGRMHFMATAAAALALALGGTDGAYAQQELSPLEQRIVASVEAEAVRSEALLARIVNINSGSQNRAGVRAVYDALAPELRSAGFQVRYADQPEATGRGGHLVATLRPAAGQARGKKLLLIGHLDTVFERDSPFQSFTRINDSIAAGPGIDDMKGGDVVIVQALKGLAAAGALAGTHITVIMTGDEESPAQPVTASRAELVAAGEEADVALGFEGAGRGSEGSTRVVIARRSASGWRLDVKAASAHSSGIFRGSAGAGAVYEIARILDRFYAEIRGEEGLTFNVGVILGGTDVAYDAIEARGTAFGKSNVIPPTAVATGDIRTLTDEQLQRTRERMRQIVRQGLPGTSAEITFTDSYPAMPRLEGSADLLRLYEGASLALGYGRVIPDDPLGRGAADISFVAPHVEAALDGLGIIGGGAHTVRETANLRSLTVQAKRAALLIHRLTR